MEAHWHIGSEFIETNENYHARVSLSKLMVASRTIRASETNEVSLSTKGIAVHRFGTMFVASEPHNFKEPIARRREAPLEHP